MFIKSMDTLLFSPSIPTLLWSVPLNAYSIPCPPNIANVEAKFYFGSDTSFCQDMVRFCVTLDPLPYDRNIASDREQCCCIIWDMNEQAKFSRSRWRAVLVTFRLDRRR